MKTKLEGNAAAVLDTFLLLASEYDTGPNAAIIDFLHSEDVARLINAALRNAELRSGTAAHIREQADRREALGMPPRPPSPAITELLVLEYGYKACERGDNLQKAVSDFIALRTKEQA